MAEHWYSPYMMGYSRVFSPKMSEPKRAQYDNDLEFRNLFHYYYNLWMSSLRIEGDFPATMDERTTKNALFWAGCVGFAKPRQYGGVEVSLPAAPGGNVNMYGWPNTGWIYGRNGLNLKLPCAIPGAEKYGTNDIMTKLAGGVSDDSEPEMVIAYANYARYPIAYYVIRECERMASIRRSIDVAIANLRCPIVVKAPETDVKTVKRLFEERDENKPVILGSKGLKVADLDVINMQIPTDTVATFQNQDRNTESRLLEFLGLNTQQNSDKRERLLVGEIEANDDKIHKAYESTLDTLNYGCEMYAAIGGSRFHFAAGEEEAPDGEPDDAGGDGTDAGAYDGGDGSGDPD